MQALIIDNDTDDLVSVESFCRRRNIEYSISNPNILDKQLAKDFDIVILSGGIWYEDPTQQELHYRQELEYIAHSEVPILGICLGMQLISAAFGGELMKLKNEYHGENKISLTVEGQEKIVGLAPILSVYENHTVGVVKSPPQFEVLARSSECIEIMHHKTLPILCMQFHPEKSKAPQADKLWNSMFKLLNVQ